MDNEIELSGRFFDAGGRESDREPDVELELGGIEIIQQAFQFGLGDGISLVIGAVTFVRVIQWFRSYRGQIRQQKRQGPLNPAFVCLPICSL